MGLCLQRKIMQFHSKQIGTLPGDHNQPGGPATERTHMKKNILKKEYQPGGSKRHEILEKAVRYLLDPRFGTQNFKHSFLTKKLGLSETEYLEALNKATNGGVVESVWN